MSISVKGNLLRYNIEKKVVIPERVPIESLIGRDVTEWLPATKRDKKIQIADEVLSEFFGTLGRPIDNVYTGCERFFNAYLKPRIQKTYGFCKSYLGKHKNSGVTLKITK